MISFSNPIVLPEDLPHLAKESFHPLDRKHLYLSLVRWGILLVIFWIALAVIFFVSDGKIPPGIALAALAGGTLLFAVAMLHTLRAFPKKGYLLRQNDISFHRGLLSYRLTTVPFGRIQHVEVNQGVIAKILGLSTLKLFTAGGSSSDLSIPGLPEEEAQKMKSYLSEKIGAQTTGSSFSESN